jgi:L-asparaginase
VFALGGTIASVAPGHDPAGVTPRLSAHELLAAVPQVADVADVDAVTFRAVPSSDLALPDLIELAAEIRVRFEHGFSGAVVTQGTDTIEETSFALDLLTAGRPNPVVVTGAMRNPTLAGPDGPANLLAAVRVAADPAAARCGTLVVLNDEIHAARFVRKTHTSNPATFRSPTVGPLGWLVEDRVRIPLAPRSAVPQLSPQLSPQATDVRPVALLPAALGDDGRLVGELARLGYRGLVVEAFGGGHVPSAAVPSLAELAEQVPVVLTSRAGAGEILRETYGFPGSERDLLARGLIAAGYLDGRKARILLALLLASGADRTAIGRAFESFGGGDQPVRHANELA